MSEGLRATQAGGGFAARHRFLLVLLWIQVPALAVVGLTLDEPTYEVALTTLCVFVFALVGMVIRDRRLAATAVALGLVTCAVLFVHHAGRAGFAHFAFFVMIAAISFYRDWMPLAVAILSATVYHLVVSPGNVLLHTAAMVAMALLLVAGWRLSEPIASEVDRSGARFRIGFEEAPIGMAVLKPSGELLEVNKAMAEILGYDRRSLITTNITTLIHSDDQAELGEAWEEMGNSPTHTAMEWMRCLTAKGKPIWGRVSLSLVPRTPNQSAMVILQLEDVSHTYEEQRRLESLLRGKDEFVAAVGDEIRKPLGLLIDLTDLADHAHVDTSQTLPRIESHAREIASIVDDLVVSAKAGTTPISVVAQHVDAEELCREVIAAAAGANAITVDFRARDLWADPMLTRQVVNSLVTNAIRYGGPTIALRTVSSGPDTVIQVSDDGPEIPLPERERVFSGDLRSGQLVTRPAAVGLSLTVGRHLARSMEGDVEYRRTADGENLFELRLPSEQITEIPRPMTREEEIVLPA